VDYENAKLTLLRHGCGAIASDGQPDVESRGFVGMLRPYAGLIPDNLHVVLEAMFIVGDRIHVDRQADLSVVETLWHMCITSRAYGLDPSGMLRI